MALQLDPKKDAALLKRLTGGESAPARKSGGPRGADSSRQGSLATLAGYGWTLYTQDDTGHYFTNPKTGAKSAPQPTYDAAIDALARGAGREG